MIKSGQLAYPSLQILLLIMNTFKTLSSSYFKELLLNIIQCIHKLNYHIVPHKYLQLLGSYFIK